MRGSLDVREIEDVGETALSYSEVKALATGDPRILEKAKIDAEVTRLERLERSHGRTRRTLSATIDRAEKALPALEAARDQLDRAIEHRLDTSGDRFAMTVGSTRWTARAEAAIALRNELAAIGGSNPDTTQLAAWDRPNHVGSLGGFDVIATPRRFLEPHLSLELSGIPRSTIRVDYYELRADRPLGIVLQLENRIRDIERTRHSVDDEAATLAREADRARDDHGKPFARHDALTAARIRSSELAAELAEQDKNRRWPAEEQGNPEPSPASTGRLQQPTVPIQPGAAQAAGHAPAGTSPPPSGRDWTAQPPRSPDEHTQMAKDTAAVTFAARTPITQMDRPSVERELRHVHGDTTFYATAHASRDALLAARDRAADPALAEDPIPQVSGVATATATSQPDGPLEHAPPGGRTEADRVALARDSWEHLFRQTQPQVLTDPHWPALAAEIERLDAAGADVAALIAHVVADRELPVDHPARSIDYRLANLVPPPPSPPRPSGDYDTSEKLRTPARSTPMQFDPRPAPRTGPGR